MSFLVVGIAAAAGVAQIGMALSGSKKRKTEQKAAANELAQRKSAYEQMDTSNPYANMENTMEDLTVNQQQAQFQAQQGNQQRANIMQNMQGAAGGSGIAGLAQAMANQGAQATQQASASIGQQESRNNMATARQAAQNQQMERQGDARSQDKKQEKTETLLGMAQGRKGAADAARQRAKDQVAAGIGTIGAAGVQGAKAGNKNLDGGENFFAGNFINPNGN
tara:strand:+ start:1169 stop:1834 length:666 start_codon:yes stop_codon:yes gene_type:complete